jgi:tetratricopeptide (TPR) repeat protein
MKEVWSEVPGIPFLAKQGNKEIVAMAEFGGKLYVGTGRPGIAQSARVYRLVQDGCKKWEDVTPPWSPNTGSSTDIEVRPMLVFKNNLYVGTDQGEVWWTDGLGWKNVTAKWSKGSITDMAEFNESLYISFSDATIWRTKDGSSWEPVVGPPPALHSEGFGDSKRDNSLGSLEVFGKYLYAGVGRRKWDPKQGFFHPTGIELWRTKDGEKWSLFKKVENPTVSFGESLLRHVYAMRAFNKYLYVGKYHGTALWRTNGSSWESNIGSGDIKGTGVFRLEEHNGKFYLGMNDLTGAGQFLGTSLLYYSTNGKQWKKVPGSPVVDTNTVAITSLLSYGGRLYVGTLNHSKSGSVALLELGPEIVPDKYEPNDTMAISTLLKLSSTKTQTSTELTDLTLHENDVDCFKIDYPSLSEKECFSSMKKSLGAGLVAEFYPGYLSILAQEEYCRPLILEIYGSKKNYVGKFHTADEVSFTCQTKIFKEGRLFLRVSSPKGQPPVRYKLSVTFSNGWGKISGKFLYKFWEYVPPPYPPPPFLKLLDPATKYFDINQFIDDSEEYLSEFIEYRGKIDKADLEHGLGRMAHLAWLYDSAERFYRQSLTAFQELKITAREADVLRSLGELYSAQGKAEKAQESFEIASQLHEKLEDPLGLAHDRISLGRHYLAKGEAPKSLATLEEALVLQIGIPDRSGQVLNLLYQCEAFLVLKWQEAAVACLILAEDLSSRMEDSVLCLEVDLRTELISSQLGEQEFLELKECLDGHAETVRHRAMSMITRMLPSFVIANCAEGLGLFDQEYKDEEGKGYPVIDKQVLYEGKPTCKAIDMCGIQAHAGYYLIGSGGKEFEFDIDEYPSLYLTMKAEKDTVTCLLLMVHDKEPKDYMRRFVAIGKTRSGNQRGVRPAEDCFTIKDDNKWHDYTYDLHKLRGNYPDAKTVRMVQFYSGKLCNGIQHAFHFSSLVFKK